MAATMIRVSRLCTKTRSAKCLLTSVVPNRRFSSNIPEDTLVETEVADIDDDAEIATKRNASGLEDRLRDRMSHVMKMPDTDIFEYQKSAVYQRRLYAKFGRESGINPQIAWPSREELKLIKEEEEEWEPSLQEMWSQLEEKKNSELEERRRRETLIEKNMSQMNKWIKEYEGRQAAKEKVKLKQQDKKLKLLEEAREFFGYEVDPRDAKFQEMVEEKEIQAKKDTKARKKQEKAARLAAQLQRMVSEAQAGSSEGETQGSITGEQTDVGPSVGGLQGDQDSHELDKDSSLSHKQSTAQIQDSEHKTTEVK